MVESRKELVGGGEGGSGIERIEKNLKDHIRACLYPDWNNPLERRKNWWCQKETISSGGERNRNTQKGSRQSRLVNFVMGRWRCFSDGFYLLSEIGSEVIHCEGEVDDGGLWREENGPCKYSRTAGNLGLLEALAISAMRCQLGLCPFLPPIMLSYARAGVELVSWKDGMRQSELQHLRMRFSQWSGYLWWQGLGRRMVSREVTEGKWSKDLEERSSRNRESRGLGELSTWRLQEWKLESWYFKGSMNDGQSEQE